MFRKTLISVLAIGIVITIGRVTIIAQTAVTTGMVELVNTDGTRTPVAGAVIDIYRTDIKGGVPSAKTNKRGEFGIAGLMLGGEYTFSVSAPGCAPMLQYKVKAGQEKILISLSPGDGRKYTEQEARQASASAKSSDGPAEMSEEEKKERAELEAKNKEIEAKNQKIEKANQIIARANKEGGDAYAAKDYDTAILKYTEGIDADPDFIGSAPIFYNNRSAALTQRAINNFNRLVKVTDPAEKLAGMPAVKKDFADAVDGYVKSWNMLKAATPEPNAKAAIETHKLTALRGAKEAMVKATQTEQIDPSLVEAAKSLLPEYSAVETDPVKKHEASMVLGHMYRILEKREDAVVAYKKVLETSPDDVDALAYAGIMLVDLGWLKDNDKELSQEGANFLQKFVSVAPDTHKLKAGAVEYLAILKAQSIIPVKATPTKRKN